MDDMHSALRQDPQLPAPGLGFFPVLDVGVIRGYFPGSSYILYGVHISVFLS